MNRTSIRIWLQSFFLLASAGAFLGCAHYEVNNGRGSIPGYYIRTEMQQADRAVEAARSAGKDKICPADFQAAEAAKNKAYDVFRACFTEEGAALANKAAAMANALCPPQAAQAAPAAAEPPLAPVPAAEPTPERFKYCIGLGIEFDINRAEVRTEYRDEVAKVGDFMKKYPTTTATSTTSTIGTTRRIRFLYCLNCWRLISPSDRRLPST